MTYTPGAKSSLTDAERDGSHVRFNLTDAHLRGPYLPEQVVAIGEALRSFAFDRPDDVQTFLDDFFTLARQPSHADFDPVPIFHEAASLALDASALALRDIGASRVGVIHPTFDNLPALYRHHVEPVPVEDSSIWSDELDRVIQEQKLGALLVVVPNNPTGTMPTREEFDRLVEICEANRCALVVDVSFRLHDPRFDWDLYGVLNEHPSVSAIVIEDMGKSFPTNDLKFALISSRGELAAPVHQAVGIMDVPTPSLTLQLIHGLVKLELDQADWQTSGATIVSRQVNVNRAALRRAVASTGLQPSNATSRVSVEWLRLPETWVAQDVVDTLAASSVAVLPGNKFFWADEERGNSFIRIALGRDTNEFSEAMTFLLEGIGVYGSRFDNQAAPGFSAQRTLHD